MTPSFCWALLLYFVHLGCRELETCQGLALCAAAHQPALWVLPSTGGDVSRAGTVCCCSPASAVSVAIHWRRRVKGWHCVLLLTSQRRECCRRQEETCHQHSAGNSSLLWRIFRPSCHLVELLHWSLISFNYTIQSYVYSLSMFSLLISHLKLI